MNDIKFMRILSLVSLLISAFLIITPFLGVGNHETFPMMISFGIGFLIAFFFSLIVIRMMKRKIKNQSLS